jgi:ribosomal protein L7Ae-like RNA K-turn-binding protein
MRGKARILICTRDISRGTLDKILSAAQKGARKESEPALYSFGESERLGMALGRPPRTVLAIEDKGFADGLAQMLDDLNEEDADER